jgi:hypothetical protein
MLHVTMNLDIKSVIVDVPPCNLYQKRLLLLVELSQLYKQLRQISCDLDDLRRQEMALFLRHKIVSKSNGNSSATHLFITSMIYKFQERHFILFHELQHIHNQVREKLEAIKSLQPA